MGVVLCQNLGQFRPNVVKKVKNILYFTWGIPIKQKVANIVKNGTFEKRLGPHFCPIWVKNGKTLIIFKNFTLVSQS